MKRFFICIYCAISFLLLFSACKRNVETANLSALTSLSQVESSFIGVDTVNFSDSIVKNGKTLAVVNIYADFPDTGNFFLVNSIREWISESLGGTYFGPLNSNMEMFSFYTNEYLNSMRGMLHEISKDIPYYLYFDAAFVKICETDDYVTYVKSSEEFYGGFHPFSQYCGQTFRKTDGRRVGYDVFREDTKEILATLLTKELSEQYFSNESPNFNTKSSLPLPETVPFFSDSGMVFTYQEYEIGPYSDGMPQCTIPYEVLQPYFTQTGTSLIHIGDVADYEK